MPLLSIAGVAGESHFERQAAMLFERQIEERIDDAYLTDGGLESYD